jgi:peptidoglycan/LPS O-acetylase OafA/YrhL
LGGFQTLSTLPVGAFTGSHLWFLYYLAVITVLFFGARALLRVLPFWQTMIIPWADSLIARLATSPFAVAILTVPTAIVLWFMRAWSMDTPDRSLLPDIPVLTVYGGFFILGWMLRRQPEAISRFARLTLFRWILAGIGIGAILLLGGIEGDFGHSYRTAAHVAYALGYALTMWSLVFLTLGIFRKLFARPNPLTRYVADSSYWMYLIHLPIVVWLQVAVAEIPMHWSLKLGFVSVFTIVISLLTYDLFVRSTLIGLVLNGRRRDRVIAPTIMDIFLTRPRLAFQFFRSSPKNSESNIPERSILS